MNKGFTLIEILAVIVVLGIVAVITVPYITDVIQKARKDSFIDSTYALVDAANNYRSKAIMDRSERTLNIDFSKGIKPLKISGEVPDSGNLIMDQEGNIEFEVWHIATKTCVKKTKNDSKVKVIENANKASCHL